MISWKLNGMPPHQHGFSLLELMVAMAIGLFMIAGVFTAYVNGRHSQNTVDDQVAMVDTARFALEVIAADIRQAGVYGRTKEQGKLNTPTFPAGSTTGECAPGWIANINEIPPVQVFDGTSAYPASCTADYFASVPASDAIEMRYSLMAPVADANLLGDVFYVQGNVDQAQLFYGNKPPIPELLGQDAQGKDRNFMYVTNLYYIAANGDAGDGVPSLHRVTLQPGGPVDQILLTGVENMQIQFGIDSNHDSLVDRYQDSLAAGMPTTGAAVTWRDVRSVQIWLVVRSPKADLTLNTVINPVIGAGTVTIPAGGVNDGFRRIVVSTVALLRNGP